MNSNIGNHRSLNKMVLVCNPHQGTTKKVLAICSAGLLRSPTIAHTLSSEPYNYNTRAAGILDEALVKVDEYLAEWADEIVCADHEHYDYMFNTFDEYRDKLVCLKLPDHFPYRDPELVRLIKERYGLPNTNDK